LKEEDAINRLAELINAAEQQLLNGRGVLEGTIQMDSAIIMV
jgi:hypothetical protein